MLPKQQRKNRLQQQQLLWPKQKQQEKWLPPLPQMLPKQQRKNRLQKPQPLWPKQKQQEKWPPPLP